MFRLKAGMRLATALIAVGSVFAWTEQAEAAYVTVIYTGKVANSHDLSGVFGAAGASLDGDAFTATYVFDPSVSVIESGSRSNISRGGTSLGTPSPLISAALTINGISYSFGGSYDEIDNAVNPSNGVSGLWVYAYSFLGSPGSIPSGYARLNNKSSGNLGIPAKLGPYFGNVSGGTGGFNNGAFSIFTLYGYASDGAPIGETAFGDLINETLTISGGTAGAVPEPATWAMMIAGMAVVAGTLRRRTAIRQSARWTQRAI